MRHLLYRGRFTEDGINLPLNREFFSQELIYFFVFLKFIIKRFFFYRNEFKNQTSLETTH